MVTFYGFVYLPDYKRPSFLLPTREPWRCFIQSYNLPFTSCVSEFTTDQGRIRPADNGKHESTGTPHKT